MNDADVFQLGRSIVKNDLYIYAYTNLEDSFYFNRCLLCRLNRLVSKIGGKCLKTPSLAHIGLDLAPRVHLLVQFALSLFRYSRTAHREEMREHVNMVSI